MKASLHDIHYRNNIVGTIGDTQSMLVYVLFAVFVFIQRFCLRYNIRNQCAPIHYLWAIYRNVQTEAFFRQLAMVGPSIFFC